MLFDSIRRSISRKFMAAVVLTTFLAVGLSGLANLAYDLHDFRQGIVADLATQAEILGQVSLAALEFDDRASAATTLRQLQARPGVLAAAIYRADGRLFASYRAAGHPGELLPALPGGAAQTIDGNDLRLQRVISRGKDKLGTIYLHASYPVDARIRRGGAMLAAVIAASMAIAALVSFWLQAAVTRPVKAMTATVRKLVASRDYSQRVSRTTDDEAGVLVDAFNSMLAEIGSHAALIEQSNASLQRENAQRIEAEQALQSLNASLEERIEARSLELARANEQLRHAQKMEAIGQLTGGVAHDFNNVLQVISGNLQLLAMAFPNDLAAQRRIDTARFATDRGAKLAAQLLAFARKQPLQPAPTHLGRVLRTMDDMLRRALGESVDIESVVAGGLWNTLVDPHQIENVILNLAINARDAMGGHGKLTLEVGNAMLDDQYVSQEHEVAAGQYVMLAISDTGCGMPPAVLARAFEPFFTTKREGEGTGLGLSMAFGFVKQSSGHIKIYSEVGSGTTIKIYLPRSHAAELIAFNPNIGEVVGGSETILVVEDDASVQATAVDMLGALGYRVLAACDGADAMRVLDSGEHVDMLFTDVVMPGPLRSPELARRAKALLPQIAVLFTSGYTQNAIVHGGRLDADVELISKPYQRGELARKIRHVFSITRKAALTLSVPATAMGTEAGTEANSETPAEAVLAAAAVADAVPAPAPQLAAAGTLRILVVEDDDDNRQLQEELLGMLGHHVSAAPHAEAALQLFADGSFGLLLTDMHLPGMSGLALAQTLQARVPALRVIIASGAAVPAPADGSCRFQHLTKPYTIDQLEALLGGG